MTERHYGNDVPTGPIPVIPPQEHTDAPPTGRSPSIPAQRRSSTASGSTAPDAGTGRGSSRRWLWLLLALLVVLGVAAAIVLGLLDTVYAAVSSSGASSTSTTQGY